MSSTVSNVGCGKPRVFSAMQPTGDVHLGNYLGAIRNWISLQECYDSIFCIADFHSITAYRDPAELRNNIYSLCAILLACGIDINKSKLFVQSRVPYHPALAWILDCNISFGDMNRMTQFKDRSSKGGGDVNVGVFNYPALMAADILLYQTDFVPVGSDQLQHLELTRGVASRFNSRYGECFKVPNPIIPTNGSKIMSLDNPSLKMSKSNPNRNGLIGLLDTSDEISYKVRRAVTDSERSISFDPGRPGLYNLLCIYECITLKKRSDIEAEFDSYARLKDALIQVIIDELAPIKVEFLKIVQDVGYMDRVLGDSEDLVRPLALATYNSARSLLGLL